MGEFYRGRPLALQRDALFLELVLAGMTREELRQAIARRPDVWQRYSPWLDRLPKDDRGCCRRGTE